MDSYIQNLFAERIGGSKFGKDTTIYKFEKIYRAKQAAKELHPDIQLIDMGVGEPDDMADMGIVNTLSEAASKWENRGYAETGIDEFKSAVAKYLGNVYGVKDINPKTEIMHCLGSKAAFAMIPAAFINSGDVILQTVPGYPVMATHTKFYGGEVYNMPISRENNFLPDLDAIPADIVKRAKLLYLNYPNNPTGSIATYEFFEKVVDFAKKNNIIVIHDAAYGALVFEGLRPLSFLSVPGAKDVGVEVHSLSKAFNMTGWRIGFVAGNELIVRGYTSVKENTDSGQFKAVQKAGIYALEHPEITLPIVRKYSRRHLLLVQVLRRLGFDAIKPRGSFFMYVPIPKGIKGGRRFESAEEFSQFLIMEKLISTVPWDEVGHYIRLSVTFIAKDEKEEKAVIAELERRLSDLEFEF